MKQIFLTFILILGMFMVNAQNKYIAQNVKNKYDIREIGKQDSDRNANGLYDWLAGSNVTWQYTLINGGYFTIGTYKGLSESIIDDECSITFGHPFAMSSYAFPVINNHQYSPLEMLVNPSGILIKNGGELKYTVNVDNICEAEFKLTNLGSQKLRLIYKLRNISDAVQSFGMGLMYDAASGKGDDGNIIYNNQFLAEYMQITENIQDSLIFWERNQIPKGVGFCMHYTDNKPSEITIGNWQNLYYNEENINQLFDLAILKRWNEEPVQPNETIEFTIDFNLLVPDYNGQPFLRWDMPQALSVENQILFPMEINTTAQIVTDNKNFSGLKLYTPENYNISEAYSESFGISNNDTLLYKTFTMNLSEIYDSIVSEVEFKLMQGENTIDRIIQHVFIPSSPFSYEGIAVDADTVFAHNDSISLRFNAIREETGQYIYGLKNPNVFFFDEQSRIYDYMLKKDTTGGTNNADIIFVLDVTGSMGDEITDVKNNIIEFADSLTQNGINYRLGMVTFLDIIENIYDFTNDIDVFYSYVAQQYAHGGDDEPENSLEALMNATQFDFRPNSTRTIIWITDATYHINDNICPYVVQDVIDPLLMQGITVFCAGPTYNYTDWYEQIVLNTGGAFFDIYGNIRDILMEVAKTDQNPNYILAYTPEEQITAPVIYTVEVHYAGLGGSDTIVYVPNKIGVLDNGNASFETTDISLYPNPIVDHSTYLNISDKNARYCEVEVYEINGNKLYQGTYNIGNGKIEIGKHLSGFTEIRTFVLKLTVYDANNNCYQKSFKLLNN